MTNGISICMATYNGSLYIREQVDSILLQMCGDDELIICDDCSTDNTVQVIKEYQDTKIKWYTSDKNTGHVKNFEKAISLATKDLIALSDQDDVWYPNRMKQLLSALDENPNAKLVASNFDMSNSTLEEKIIVNGLSHLPKNRLMRVLSIFSGKAPYFGCTFLMRKDLLKVALPFPKGLEAHDIWIALLANTYGEVTHLDDPTLCRRLHGSNVTPTSRRALSTIIKSRMLLLEMYISRLIKVRVNNKSL